MKYPDLGYFLYVIPIHLVCVSFRFSDIFRVHAMCPAFIAIHIHLIDVISALQVHAFEWKWHSKPEQSFSVLWS